MPGFSIYFDYFDSRGPQFLSPFLNGTLAAKKDSMLDSLVDNKVKRS
jgi:hypothetical protein